MQCSTSWSLKLREEHRLRELQNRVLRRIFGPRRDEVTGDWRKLHNENLHNLYSSPSLIRMIKSKTMARAEYVVRMGRRGKPKGKRPPGRPRPTCVDNIKMDLREIRWGYMGWIDLAQDRDQWRALVNTVMKLRVP
jgi:hypothetical protein